jgi:thioredoxin:protein disulfide reductase
VDNCKAMRIISIAPGWRNSSLRITLKRLSQAALFLLLVVTSLAARAVNEADLLPPDRAFPLRVTLSGPRLVTLDFDTAPGYYLYRDRFSFAIAGAPIKPASLPPAEKKDDPTFGSVGVYHHPVRIQLPLPDSISTSVTLSVIAQGCADAGVCYPPQRRFYRIAANGAVTPVDTGRAAISSGTTQPQAAGAGPSLTVLGISLRPANGISLAALLGFFLAGLLTSGTVCMYPLVPIVTAVISGDRERSTPRRGLALSFTYVQGLALTYAIAGTAAALAGIPLVAYTQRPWVLAAFGGLMVLLALAMFGLFRFQVPPNWQTAITAWSNRLPGGRVGPVFAMGMLSALIVGPCSTPVLAGALLYIANSRDVLGGALALYAMALGIGGPLLVVGTFGARVLPRAGRWMVAVQNTLGVMLLAAALWFVYSLLPAWLLMVLVGLLSTSCGMMLRAIDPLPQEATGVATIGKAIGILLLVGGIAEFIGVASGNFDVVNPLRGALPVADKGTEAKHSASFESIRSNTELDQALAAANGRPVLIDFYADWCISCKEVERFTFTDTRVVHEFARWKLLRIDVTKNTEDDFAVLKRFGLFGPPALIFYDRDGRQVPDAQLAGFVSADEFLAHLQKWNLRSDTPAAQSNSADLSGQTPVSRPLPGSV